MRQKWSCYWKTFGRAKKAIDVSTTSGSEMNAHTTYFKRKSLRDWIELCFWLQMERMSFASQIAFINGTNLVTVIRLSYHHLFPTFVLSRPFFYFFSSILLKFSFLSPNLLLIFPFLPFFLDLSFSILSFIFLLLSNAFSFGCIYTFIFTSFCVRM